MLFECQYLSLSSSTSLSSLGNFGEPLSVTTSCYCEKAECFQCELTIDCALYSNAKISCCSHLNVWCHVTVHAISRLELADLGEALSANRWITRVWHMQGQSFGPWPTLRLIHYILI